MARLKDIDERAVSCAKALAADFEVQPSLKGLVSALPKEEGQQLHGLANRVTVVSRNVQEVLAKNRKLIENEMTYINGTLTLIARAAVHTRGPYRKRSVQTILVDRVA
jgi:hypothetical protein